MKSRKKRRFNFLRVLKLILILIVAGMIYSLGVAVSENIRSNRAIEAFKSRAVFEYEEEFEYVSNIFQTRRYYKVSRETSYELEDTRSVFYDESRKYLGQKGDIFMTDKSPFPGIPVVHQFITFYFGGHAAINNGDNRFVEAVGFPDEDETVWDFIKHPGDQPHDYSATVNLTRSNYWLNPMYRNESDPDYQYYGSTYRREFIGLRVKGVTQTQLDDAVDYATDKVDKNLYNFLYFLDMSYKYYCTDLVSRAYQHALVDEKDQRNYSRALNDDGFITSVNDIILSRETYIAFYVEIRDDIVHIYYLEDI
ncbi:YiiX/YebB-like N1pC/P60 family cysteine hydrolase [Peloplasma aerotolerans]|uniref:YiiX/YebB-like N1pC/P60 family cysteine hydrolase n=1 Tax=Peloplasma aerotolerans TaxID=3044389 RepID=A0AAW6U7Z4_9MOLU|nr:YiiX/YebB-like N1pC/P60 family cysteine hydrolase [Mariniplasma sp. M4Ah]MDI6452201.1 YiiX/YebB-like N1pC/P60 family cysteine hydrolase [Mariniplasma sp. M4Ah]